jgi:hypothetical protein
MPSTSRTAFARLTFAAGAAVLAISAAVAYGFVADDADKDAKTGAELRFGTYEPQVAFQSYYKFPEFNNRLQELQGQLQSAYEAGDQQRAFMLQQQVQAVQHEAVTAFIEDVDRAMPKIAAEADVQLIVLEVVYVAEGIGQPKNLTQAVIAELNKNAEPKDRPQGEQRIPLPFRE